MLILNMLLRITKFTQEELANYLGVSRASINSWLNDDSSMTDSSKNNIANKFQFPVSYFGIDLKQNLNIYKIIFSTLYDNWKRHNMESNNNSDTNCRINQILNEVEIDLNSIYNTKLSESIKKPVFLNSPLLYNSNISSLVAHLASFTSSF